MPRTLLCLGCGVFTMRGHYNCVPGILKVVCGIKLNICLWAPVGPWVVYITWVYVGVCETY
jgi:hypothetical protein